MHEVLAHRSHNLGVVRSNVGLQSSNVEFHKNIARSQMTHCDTWHNSFGYYTQLMITLRDTGKAESTIFHVIKSVFHF